MNQQSDYFHHETERLILRRLQNSDIDKWAGFFTDNPSLHFMGIMNTGETKNYSHREQSKKWIDIQFERYQQTGYGLLAVISKETGNLIGQAGISEKELEDKTEHEIGYSLMPSEWGKGYASEMSSILVNYAVKHKINRRIISIIHVDNLASQNVARKNKMKVLFKTRYKQMDVDVYGRDI